LTLPIMHSIDALRSKATEQLLKRGGKQGDFLETLDDAIPTVEKWNSWLRMQILELSSYLRQRLYKVRPHLVMLMEMRHLEHEPQATAAPDVDDPGDDNEENTQSVTLEGADSHSVLRMELGWKEALDQVVEMLSPRYNIRGHH